MNSEDRSEELSPANRDAIAFPLRLLRLANSAHSDDEVPSFTGLAKQVGAGWLFWVRLPEAEQIVPLRAASRREQKSRFPVEATTREFSMREDHFEAVTIETDQPGRLDNFTNTRQVAEQLSERWPLAYKGRFQPADWPMSSNRASNGFSVLRHSIS
jgi:hypothetical protein